MQHGNFEEVFMERIMDHRHIKKKRKILIGDINYKNNELILKDQKC